MSEVSCQKYRIRAVHDTLYVELMGTWAPEDTLQFLAADKKLVASYFARERGEVLCRDQLDMLIEEDFQIETFRSLFTWSFIKGLGALSVVKGPANRDHLLFQFEEILNHRQPVAVSLKNNLQEAVAWLAEEGYEILEPFGDRKTA